MKPVSEPMFEFLQCRLRMVPGGAVGLVEYIELLVALRFLGRLVLPLTRRPVLGPGEHDVVMSTTACFRMLAQNQNFNVATHSGLSKI